jgi:hypothetical protein
MSSCPNVAMPFQREAIERTLEMGCQDVSAVLIAAAIEDQQLMPDQRGFDNNGTESARPCQSGHGGRSNERIG